MTRRQMAMALAALDMRLKDMAQDLDVDPSWLSRIRAGKVGTTSTTMRNFELYFTELGVKFRQENDHVWVGVIDHPEEESP